MTGLPTKATQLLSDIWVMAQLASDGRLMPVSLELIGQGRLLADKRHATLSVLLASAVDLEVQCEIMLSVGADRVYLCQDRMFASGVETPYYEWLAAMAEMHQPEIILLGATEWGRSLAPRVAARLRTGLTADCTVLEIDETSQLLHQTRPAFGGNVMATIVCTNHRPQMATVRPGIFPLPRYDQERLVTDKGTNNHFSERVILCKPPENVPQFIELIHRESIAESESIADSEILFVAGRGIGSQKNLKLMQSLAESLGAQWGVSRPLVDAGWAEYRYQVGQTGSTVAPKLLISFGVSGSIQHLAGMGRCESIVAINTDATAPIFSVAQVGIIGDCVEVIKEWHQQCKVNKLV